MGVTFDCTDPRGRERGITRATAAVQKGQLVVLPTDTYYGLGCDAFSAPAVTALREARGAGRAAPPPVMIGHVRTLDGLASDVSPQVRRLVEAFWPGPLTVICRAQPSLDWDLGDSYGTVALRMPLHPVALELLEAVGPMAVTGAHRVGEPPATTTRQTLTDLEEAVAVLLDAGSCAGTAVSTVLDGTRGRVRVLRVGAISVEQLREEVPEVLAPGEQPPPAPVQDGDVQDDVPGDLEDQVEVSGGLQDERRDGATAQTVPTSDERPAG
jgi:L-threonylcarbamoyladenylate synthase